MLIYFVGLVIQYLATLGIMIVCPPTNTKQSIYFNLRDHPIHYCRQNANSFSAYPILYYIFYSLLIFLCVYVFQ